MINALCFKREVYRQAFQIIGLPKLSRRPHLSVRN